MRAVTLEDIKDIAAYERVRDSYRKDIIALKNRRRVKVGDSISLVFENRDTVTFQVQEMMRAERIVDEKKIQYELDVYNALLPNRFELSATLLIEITDQAELRRRLPTLLGIEEHLWLNVNGSRIQAKFEEGRSTEEKLSTIHYVRFQLSPDDAKAFTGGEGQVSLEFDHPNYKVTTVLSPEYREAIGRDLEEI